LHKNDLRNVLDNARYSVVLITFRISMLIRNKLVRHLKCLFSNNKVILKQVGKNLGVTVINTRIGKIYI